MRFILLAWTAAFLVAVPGSATAPNETAAAMFLDHCGGCHTVGEGDTAGPDLLPATKYPAEDLRTAVKRMEDNVGPMKPEDVETYVALLQSPDLKRLLTAAAHPAPPPPTRPAGSATEGRRLFFGERALANGGSPCFACHAVDGCGGNLAADLTTVAVRRSEAAVLTSTEKPAFPLMKAAYTRHPVTPDEAQHLAAYFRQAAGGTPRVERLATVHGGAAAFVIAVMAVVALVFRARRAGVRARLVRAAARREKP